MLMTHFFSKFLLRDLVLKSLISVLRCSLLTAGSRLPKMAAHFFQSRLPAVDTCGVGLRRALKLPAPQVLTVVVDSQRGMLFY